MRKRGCVLQYFDRCWHPDETRKQWATYLTNKLHNYQNRTNNREESLNQKLEGVITKYSSLPEFNPLWACISSMNLEKDHRIMYNNAWKPTSSSSFESFLHRYFCLLTRFAFDKVHTQVELSQDVRFDSTTNDCGILIHGGEARLTFADRCFCPFFSTL